jgi:hypothetical protein
MELDLMDIMELARTDPGRVERAVGGWLPVPDYVCPVEAGDFTYIMAQHTVIVAVRENGAGERVVEAGTFCSGPALSAFIDVELGEAFKAGLADPASPQYLVLDEDRHANILRNICIASEGDDLERGELWSDIASHILKDAAT